jgi:inner membrane protein
LFGGTTATGRRRTFSNVVDRRGEDGVQARRTTIMPSWMWILLGLGLLAAETLTPGGFFVFFFGLSAILVGALASIGMAGGDQAQWILFSVLSVVSLMMLRPRLVDRFSASTSKHGRGPEFVGDTAILLEDLEPGGVAKAELRGTSWTVRSHHPGHIARGARCTVERVDGLTFWILPPL